MISGKTLARHIKLELFCIACFFPLLPVFYPRIIDRYNKLADEFNEEQERKWLEAMESGSSKYIKGCLRGHHLHRSKGEVKSSDGTVLACDMFCPRCGKEHGRYKVVARYNSETGEEVEYD